jgi:tetratricopeptide (TPR) repeat protein
VVENLLQRGTESDAWPKVEQAAKEIWFARMLDWAQRIKANAARMMAEMPSNLPGVAREMAAADAAHVMFLSSIDPRPGADGPEKRMAELFANSRQLGLALANEAASPPEFRTELLAELRADALCMEAVAPWLGLSPQQQEERYRDAVAACDRSSYVHRSLGEHLLRAGKIEEAMRHLRRSVELNPENDEGRERLALVHGAREEHDEVLALTDRPTASPVLRATRAYTLLKTGDIGSAETLACEVLDGRPNDTLALRVLAACRRARGDVAKACELEMRADLFERGVRPPAG